jgi:hypothetical protein
MKYLLLASMSCSNYSVRVHHNDVVVGEYFADLMVEDMLLLEVKAVKALDDAQDAMRQLPQGDWHAALLAA